MPCSVRALPSLFLLVAVSACVTSVPSGSGDDEGVGSGSPNAGVGGTTSGAEGNTTSGGAASGSVSGVGGDGFVSGSGGAPPVDCSELPNAGYALCSATNDTCSAVFSDSAGCTAVCATAGLACETAYENVDGVCAANMDLPALPCDSGHQSDFCLCGRGASAPGSGGAGSGGTPGTGGQTSESEDDCNTRTDLPFIEVNKNGSGDFSTVQAAIDSLPGSNSTLTVLRIAPGKYYEKLTVDIPNIILCGELGQEENTVLTYSDGSDASNGNGGTLGTSGSASVNLSAHDVSVENITFENTRGVGAQAVALLVSGARVQFKNSRFLGHQDTLYVKEGSQYFKNCHIEGTVDFIFGGATAVFDECTIHNVGGGTAVTAPSTEEGVAFGIVFLGGKLTATPSVSSGSVNLGRNWRPYGSTTYIETELGSHITAVGWTKMGENILTTARFSEYQSKGPGANPGARASESKQLSAVEAAAFNVDDLFGSWDPSYAE